MKLERAIMGLAFLSLASAIGTYAALVYFNKKYPGPSSSSTTPSTP